MTDGLAVAIATTTKLATDSERDMALRAMRLWSETVGVIARDKDRLRLQQLIGQLACKQRQLRPYTAFKLLHLPLDPA